MFTGITSSSSTGSPAVAVRWAIASFLQEACVHLPRSTWISSPGSILIAHDVQLPGYFAFMDRALSYALAADSGAGYGRVRNSRPGCTTPPRAAPQGAPRGRGEHGQADRGRPPAPKAP